MQLRRVVLPVSTRGFGKLAEIFYSLKLIYKKLFIHFSEVLESFKEFWVNLGISGSLGLGKPYAEEDPKGLYDPKKMILEMYMGRKACY